MEIYLFVFVVDLDLDENLFECVFYSYLDVLICIVEIEFIG